MYLLGISAWYHDSAACLVKDGEVVAAAQEERFTRIKHDSQFPSQAVNYCLMQANIQPSDVEFVVFYEKPFIKFERLLETYLAFAPRGFASFKTAMPLWIRDKLFHKRKLKESLVASIGSEVNWTDRLLFSEHHLSHAASAFFPSPFRNAAVLSLDGVGEWATSSLTIGNENNLTVIQEISFPHSLGLLYSAFTYYLGFKVNSGEYKVMGLAPYGEPKYTNLIKDHLMDIKADGTFRLDMNYFNYCTGLTMTSEKLHSLFGGPPRNAESELTQKDMDIAASVQQVTEEVVVALARSVAKETGERNLCLAGGVALNCVANGKLLKENIFEKIWIQPAAGDAGGAVGAALGAYHLHLGKPRLSSSTDAMKGSYLGPSFSNSEVKQALTELGAVYKQHEPDSVLKITSEALQDGKAVGWMQGRMEFGPRALGNRSIIADPRSPKIQKQLNLKIKYRESFRPFAPSVIFTQVNEWFDLVEESPYMLIVADVSDTKKRMMTREEDGFFGIDKLNVVRSEIPAVTHVDYSARVQTVHRETNPRYHKLIETFYESTGCPILVNTSFNVRGEPIVCDPGDAFRCFMGCELDVLVIEDCILFKEDQNPELLADYKGKYAPD